MESIDEENKELKYNEKIESDDDIEFVGKKQSDSRRKVKKNNGLNSFEYITINNKDYK